MFGMKTEIEKKIDKIERDMKSYLKPLVSEKLWITHYGAVEIDPKYLVFWICVMTDREKGKLQSDPFLYDELRTVLTKHNYPVDARKYVHIGFESQETVDRESNGNWWQHWK